MGTKNNPGKFDCYANAHPDEPMFVLLARDKHAPMLVWLWALLRRLDKEDPAKVAEATECCSAMLAWQAAHDRTSVGLGQTALAAVMGLIAAANIGVKRAGATNSATTEEELLRYFALTTIEGEG